jgi:hypothetical protein
MHDEALTTVAAAIDQMATGHQWLWDTLGVRPEYGWQVDPFGASTVTPTLFAWMGFKGANPGNFYFKKIFCFQKEE